MFELRSADLVGLFTQELELCRVRRDESVVVLAEPESRPDYVAAAFAAASSLHANVCNLVVPGGSPVRLPTTHTGTGYGLQALDSAGPILDLLRGCDLVIDLTLEGNIHTPLLQTILAADTRVLFVCEAPDILARNLARPQDKEEVREATERLRRTRTLRITSDAGTDLTADLRDSHPGFQCGFADDPGRWDHWPSKMVLCWPQHDGVHGRLVLDTGDIIFPFKEFISAPVTLAVESGRIVEVSGGLEAKMINRFMRESGDPAASMLSHMGWGLLGTADWLAMGMYDKESLMGMDGRSAAGNFLTSTGPHPFEDRWTPYHLDLPLAGCTVELDGTPVTKAGSLVT